MSQFADLPAEVLQSIMEFANADMKAIARMGTVSKSLKTAVEGILPRVMVIETFDEFWTLAANVRENPDAFAVPGGVLVIDIKDCFERGLDGRDSSRWQAEIVEKVIPNGTCIVREHPALHRAGQRFFVPRVDRVFIDVRGCTETCLLGIELEEVEWLHFRGITSETNIRDFGIDTLDVISPQRYDFTVYDARKDYREIDQNVYDAAYNVELLFCASEILEF